MSAIVCGKRPYFEELPDYSLSPVTKRFCRVSSPSRVRFSLSPPRNGLVDRLKELFPSVDNKHLDKALDDCGGDLDSAIKRLHELCLEYSKGSASANDVAAQVEQVPAGETSVQSVLPADGTQWVELVVHEMTSATSMDDARCRAAKVLEALEKSVRANASSGTAENCQKENSMLKDQIEGLMRENGIFKRAVQIQHLRQKEFDEKSQEVQQLKQLLSQYQEQLRGLEVNNYALSMHLKQAQQSNSLPGHFHPDIF